MGLIRSRSLTNDRGLLFIPSVLLVTLKRADGSIVTEGGHDGTRLVYCEEFADRGILHDFSERARQLFIEKGDDYTEHYTFEEQNRVTG